MPAPRPEPTRGLTYRQVGWTATGWWPPGWYAVRERHVVGHGPAAFAALAQAIGRWGILEGAGLTVDADEDVARPGVRVRSTVGMRTLLPPGARLGRAPGALDRLLRAGPTAPCRVVWVAGTADGVPVAPLDGRIPVATAGFAYGTLPGHPERGEEAFLAHRYEDGEVAFEVRAFSTPATRFLALGAPVSRRLQRLITDRYADAARAAVTRRQDTRPRPAHPGGG
ncbi:hypothetical protein GCM10011512_16990 [Tersicoccus solisilvae]|uniref:DUF1990 domain-containing protein n=1 Tax=Tersicoccus solisilvae TaxID=1882339 RepID=A0ABQ1P3W6_9MICC|nr:DUF1990 domain-containing protein [Tersicoccus solisilvae]GGC90593.1 hypothetical protein GCM10011512_16990 [Tersicoccus solisilvae]